ncbi:MAG: sigma-54-dependent Fis family transcriptional regulator [candidate division Zixibacteria bacterium]|nr:sigma-54-dependent Fis family transcriptional regulator [candidate division Zixibacteria bacterium]
MILIVDDEPAIRSSLSCLLQDEGYQTIAVESAFRAEEVLSAQPISLILLDIQMPGKDGLTFLDENRRRLTDIPVIIISGRGDIPTAVAAIKLGAGDYIEKPLAPERVLLTVAQAMRLSRSRQTEQKLVGRLLDRYHIIGTSPAVGRMRDLIARAAAADVPVLITGENGTGKELAAHQIHYLSRRGSEPLVTVNCPAIPETLFEAELFGHVRGAFTGALRERAGRFEKASGGTLFLDEIGDLPPGTQGKLLRVLETGQYEKIGSDTTQQSDFRLLAATNRNLQEMVAQKTFREDLYYSLNVLPIEVPPLRQRMEDIPALLDFFWEELDASGRYTLSAPAAGILASYDWPGNIRQLKNVAARIVFECPPGEIGPADIERIYHQREAVVASSSNAGETGLAAAVRQFETGYLTRLYHKHNGNIAAMARELSMDRGNLSRKLKQLGIV